MNRKFVTRSATSTRQATHVASRYFHFFRLIASQFRAMGCREDDIFEIFRAACDRLKDNHIPDGEIWKVIRSLTRPVAEFDDGFPPLFSAADIRSEYVMAGRQAANRRSPKQSRNN